MKDNWELNEAPPSSRCDGIEMSKRERKIQNKKYCENAHKPMGSFERVKLVVEREKMREIRAKMKIFIEKISSSCARRWADFFLCLLMNLLCALLFNLFLSLIWADSARSRCDEVRELISPERGEFQFSIMFHRPTRSTLTLWKMYICGSGWTKIVKNRWCIRPNAHCTFAVSCIFLKSKHNKRTTWTCEKSRVHLQTSWWVKVDGRADAADTPQKYHNKQAQEEENCVKNSLESLTNVRNAERWKNISFFALRYKILTICDFITAKHRRCSVVHTKTQKRPIKNYCRYWYWLVDSVAWKCNECTR